MSQIVDLSVRSMAPIIFAIVSNQSLAKVAPVDADITPTDSDLFNLSHIVHSHGKDGGVSFFVRDSLTFKTRKLHS